MKYLKELSIGKKITFPIYLPDATRGVIRSLDSSDLKQAGVEGVVVNSYHLMSNPGQTVIKSLGKIKEFMSWDGLVVSDSGGFQLLSLIYENNSFGSVTDDGAIFYRSSKGKKKKYNFTPEKSIQIQFNIGADIMICLDDCPSAGATVEENQLSVKRTIEWAKRCRQEYLKRAEKMDNDSRPALFAVIQGGDDKNLREKCANELIKIGFEGFCFGGLPLDKDSNLKSDILRFTSSLMPDDLPKFALGVGNPLAIVECFKMGYRIFDCVLPTRDARHRRLYVFHKAPETIDVLNETNLTDFMYMGDENYVRDPRPISDYCDCYTCREYSRAYLNHLFKIEDSLAWRLSTIHNLRTYTKLIGLLREHV